MQELNFDIKKLNYKNRIGSLNISASSIVKSNKFFPVFLSDIVFARFLSRKML